MVMIDRRLVVHKLIYPVWADDNKHVILLCAAVALCGGVGSSALLHHKSQYGYYILPFAFAGLLGYGKFYVQELYHKYVACGWDMYF